VTFVPTELPIAKYFPVYLSSLRYDLYAISYQRYGRDQAQILYRNMMRPSAVGNVVWDPCLNSGFGELDGGVWFNGTSNFTRCRELWRDVL
jgi:hypothetical protein